MFVYAAHTYVHTPHLTTAMATDTNTHHSTHTDVEAPLTPMTPAPMTPAPMTPANVRNVGPMVAGTIIGVVVVLLVTIIGAGWAYFKMGWAYFEWDGPIFRREGSQKYAQLPL